MKNKIKATGIALATGIAPIIPYNVLAVEKESKLEVEWSAEFSEGGFESFESIKETVDGGFIVVGEADVREEEGGSRGDAVIVKYNKDGVQEWYNAIIGEDTDLFYNVIEANDGGFYAIGKSFSSDLDFENSNNISHAIIVKYDSEGNQEWINAVNDNGNQINYNNIIQTIEGRLVVVGDKVINSKRTGFFMEISKDTGQELFVEEMVIDGYTTRIKDITYTQNGEFVLVGSAISEIDSKERPMLIRSDMNGSKRWSYVLEEDNDDKINILNGVFSSVTEAQNGDLIVSGYTIDDSNNKDALIMSFNNVGERIWYDIVRGETSDVYTSVMINSENELVVLGESSPIENTNLLKDLKLSVTRYASDYSSLLSVSDLSEVINNASPSKAIITSEDKIVTVGKNYKKIEGLDAKCDVTTLNLPDDCVQADGMIMKIALKEVEVLPGEDENNPCEINESPIINAEDIVLTIGEEFKVYLNVTATDKENGDLTNSIKIIYNDVDTSKIGEYKVIYGVEDECGISVEKEIKVTVKEREVDSDNLSSNTEKPQTGDLGLIYGGLAMMSTIGLASINKKKK